ncbi:hypothetical protein HK105_200853 [Polyrhizophydium stewartii]|uniref:FAD dependent oxidoreductase domain-containing protein n=1 Tax=Polyrhizophydium stewartii TaxID=2732419 RepID=A0ABR4NI61_9FUNG|nr:hypothetical protein HK105_005849 [Polyrhizophydium stewartii]
MPLPRPSPPPSRYWLAGVTGALPAVLPPPAAADIVIVGAGISGASVALGVARRLAAKVATAAPTSVLLLDARDVAGGATGRNGGLMWPGLPDTWEALVAKYGVAVTKDLLRFDLDNCRAMEEAARDAPTDPALDPCMFKFAGGGINILNTQSEFDAWAKNIDDMRRGGCPDWGVSLWDSAELAKHLPNVANAVGAVHNTHAWRVRSGRLTLHLLRKAFALAHDSGALSMAFSPRTAVERVEPPSAGTSGPVRLLTSQGAIAAKTVVYCTNAYTPSLFPEVDITPIKNQVVVTDRIKRIPFDFAIKSHSGYNYVSPREDSRIVVGGMRYLVDTYEVGNDDDANLHPAVSAGLAEYVPTNLPELEPAESRELGGSQTVGVAEEWAGIMGFTSSQMPLVGQIPDRPGELICAGFSGHGIARACLCGKAVADMALGIDAAAVDDPVSLPAPFNPAGRFNKPAASETAAFSSRM